jgi:hypothetical protein
MAQAGRPLRAKSRKAKVKRPRSRVQPPPPEIVALIEQHKPPPRWLEQIYQPKAKIDMVELDRLWRGLPVARKNRERMPPAAAKRGLPLRHKIILDEVTKAYPNNSWKDVPTGVIRKRVGAEVEAKCQAIGIMPSPDRRTYERTLGRNKK